MQVELTSELKKYLGENCTHNCWVEVDDSLTNVQKVSVYISQEHGLFPVINNQLVKGFNNYSNYLKSITNFPFNVPLRKKPLIRAVHDGSKVKVIESNGSVLPKELSFTSLNELIDQI